MVSAGLMVFVLRSLLTDEESNSISEEPKLKYGETLFRSAIFNHVDEHVGAG